MSVLLTHGVGPACCICKMGSEPVTYMGVMNKQTEAQVPGTWHLCPSEALPRCSQAGKLSSLTCHSHHALLMAARTGYISRDMVTPNQNPRNEIVCRKFVRL